MAVEVPQDLTQPGQSRAPYMSRETVSGLVGEAARCIAEVRFNPNSDSDQPTRSANSGPVLQNAPYLPSAGGSQTVGAPGKPLNLLSP